MTDLNHCRLCAEMKTSSSLIVVEKNENGLNINLYHKILQCYQIEILSDDHLPKTICLSCCTQTNVTYEFFQKVQKAQELLHNIIFNTNGNGNNNSTNFQSRLDRTLDDNQIDSKLFLKTEESVDDDLSQSSTQTVSSNHIEIKEKEKCTEIKAVKENINIKSSRKSARNNSWSCNKCSNGFKTENDLITHSQNVHGESPEYKCSLCTKSYVKYRLFTQHLRVHKNQDKFRCNICNKAFNYNSSLKRHLNVYHEQNPAVKRTCPICDKIFKSPDSYDYHRKYFHLPAEDRLKYECDICKKQLTNKSNLVVHKKVHDESTKDNICDQCGVGFRIKSSLKYHIENVHREINEDNYLSCSLCPTRLKHKIQLRRHMRQVHSDKRFKCETCGKQFYYLTNYTVHMKLHTGERPFQCQYCDKRFRVKLDLENHTRQHTGERPYCCTECNHYFADFSNYIKHMRRKHGVTSFKNVKKLKT